MRTTRNTHGHRDSDQPLPGGRRGRRRTTPGWYCNPGSKQISGDQVTHAAERLARSVTILCLLPPRVASICAVFGLPGQAPHLAPNWDDMCGPHEPGLRQVAGLAL